MTLAIEVEDLESLEDLRERFVREAWPLLDQLYRAAW